MWFCGTFKGAHQKRHSGDDDVPPQSWEAHEATQKTKKPLVLTINGKAEAVVQDAEAYQRLLDIAAQANAVEGIRQGIEDTKRGRVRAAREALEMFRRNHGIPRLVGRPRPARHGGYL